MLANDKKYDSNLDRECSSAALIVSLKTCLAFGMTNPRKNDESVWRGHIYDLVFDHKGKEIRVETELKREWGENWSVCSSHPDVPYKWDSMDIPFRKRDKGVVHSHYHHVIGGDGKRAFWIPRSQVLKSPVKNKYVRNRRCEEPFFMIPLPAPGSCFWKLEQDQWKITHYWDSTGSLVS